MELYGYFYFTLSLKLQWKFTFAITRANGSYRKAITFISNLEIGYRTSSSRNTHCFTFYRQRTCWDKLTRVMPYADSARWKFPWCTVYTRNYIIRIVFPEVFEDKWTDFWGQWYQISSNINVLFITINVKHKMTSLKHDVLTQTRNTKISEHKH